MVKRSRESTAHLVLQATTSDTLFLTQTPTVRELVVHTCFHQLLSQLQWLNGIESTGEVKERDSHSDPRLLQPSSAVLVLYANNLLITVELLGLLFIYQIICKTSAALMA